MTSGSVSLQNVGMTLAEYIKKNGHAEAARLFGVSLSTIKSWRWGQRTPRPDKANEIVSVTGGEVSLSGIYAQKPSEAANA